MITYFSIQLIHSYVSPTNSVFNFNFIDFVLEEKAA